MKIAVCVKQILFTGVPFEVDQKACLAHQMEPSPIYLINPADRCAIEEAVRLKEKFGNVEVVVLTVGPARASQAIYTCLARGADRGIHLIDNAGQSSGPYVTAFALSRVIADLGCDLILCGSKSLDEGSGQVPPALAVMLGLPQVTGAIALEIEADERQTRVVRRLERGHREIIECPLPAVIAVDPTINQPRYISVHAYRHALKRKSEILELNSFVPGDADLHLRNQVIRITPPRPRPGKVFAPSSAMSASDRLKFTMTGGMVAKESKLLEEPNNKLVDRLIDILRKEGILKHSE